MNNTFQKNNIYTWLLLLLLAALVAFKWEALYLPFFWDEAWVYMPAIRTMAEQGPSVIPGSIDADLYTGHPLLFYCLASSWIKLFGYSLPVAHSFPLLISIGLLLSVFFISFQWSKSHQMAFLSTLLVAVQPIFLTQSTYLLIEVWLSLLFLWTFYFYFERQWIFFSLTLLMALWSKESAYTLVPCFLLVAWIEYFVLREGLKPVLKKWALVMLVFALGFSFFYIQKMKLGWYFFPRHANWITLDEFNYKINLAYQILFQHQGRALYFVVAIIALLAGYMTFKNELNKYQWIKFAAILIFVMGYMLFASINFFSTRYLLGAIPLLMLVCGMFFGGITNKNLGLGLIGMVCIYGAFQINKSLNNKEFSDVELSYTRLLKAQVEMVDYLKKNPLNAQTYAPFLMLVNLSNPYSGFVDQGMPMLSSNLKDSANVYFLSLPNEHEAAYDTMLYQSNLHLVYTAEVRQAWVDLHKK